MGIPLLFRMHIMNSSAAFSRSSTRNTYSVDHTSWRRKCLRIVTDLASAFMETWRDPDLLKNAATMNFEVGPTSGEEMQSFLQKVYASPPALLQSVKQAIKLK